MVDMEELTRKEILKKVNEQAKDVEIFISFDLSEGYVHGLKTFNSQKSIITAQVAWCGCFDEHGMELGSMRLIDGGVEEALDECFYQIIADDYDKSDYDALFDKWEKNKLKVQCIVKINE